ncbi:hypothetical protein J7K43_02430 [Candidatus Calescamantes bacterium]|nr:hypothetical protein [Candidatus Calescamantes bacterium]
MEKSRYSIRIFSYRTGIFISILILSLLIFVSYNNYLDNYFIGADTFSLIETARILSPLDFVKILKNPLMYGTYFIEVAKYYRPVTSLSFSLDYSLWKFKPIGYHLTNLIVHVLVAVLLFLVLLKLTHNNFWLSCTSSFLFSIHPVLIENVVVVAKRQDILASFFLLLSFLFLQNHQKNKKLSLSFSLLFYLFALGSKEFAVIFPFIILSYLFLLQREMSKSEKFKIFSLYFILSIMFIVLRTIILHGMGRMNDISELDRVILSFFYTTGNFLSDLLYPLHFLKKLFLPEPSFLEKCISLVILVLLLTIWGWFLKKTLTSIKSMTIKRITLTLIILLIINTLSMFLFPFYSHYFYNELHAAYFDIKPSFLSILIKGKNSFPYSHYINLWSEFFFSFFLTLLTLLSIIFILVYKFDELKNLAKNSTDFRVFIFLIIWMTIPLPLYLLTFAFTHRTMYFSILPFSIILSYMLTENIKNLRNHMKEWRASNARTQIKNFLFSKYFHLFLLALFLYSSTIYISPLFQNYDGWKIQSDVTKMFFDKLSNTYSYLPNYAEIEIRNLPQSIHSLKKHFPPTVLFSTLNTYTVKSWLNLHFPENHIQVKKIKYIDLPSIPEDIVLKVERKANENAIIVVQYKF